MRPRTILLLALLATTAFWIQPTGAFDHADVGARDATAAVVATGSAYNAISGGSCTSVPTSGGSCTLTITNKGTTSVTYTIRTTSNPSDHLASYGLDGQTPVAAGQDAVTAGTIAPGSSTTLTANTAECVSCAGGTYTSLWELEAEASGALKSFQSRIPMTITFAS